MRATRRRHGGRRHRALLVVVELTVVAGLMVAGGAAAAAPANATAKDRWATASEIDTFLQKERADLKMSGLAVVVLSKGRVFFDRAYGDAAPGGPAVTRNTPFVLGSTSKQFTGLAIHQLIAEGQLSLDDTVGTLLGSLGAETSPFAGITVAQLLSHTSGISTNEGTADVFDPTPGFTSLAVETRHLLKTAPSSKPGTAFEYSNGNYTLLGSIIEARTGMSFEDSLRTLVTGPLGLDSTTSDLALAQTNGLETGHYTWFGAIDSTTPGPRWPMGAPSAFTSSTAADLTRLLHAELGQPSGIDAAVFAADHAPLTTINDYSRYASGWYVRSFWELHDDDKNFDDPSLPLIYEHDGDTSRETSYLAFAPDLGFGVVVLSNTGVGPDTSRFSDLTYRLLHTIVGTTPRPREVDPLVAAAPTIMVALPLAQLAALVVLIFSFLRPRHSRVGRWMQRIVVSLVTLVTVLVVFLVVPGQTHEPLLNRVWWSSVPDLAVSVAVSALGAAVCAAVGIVGARAENRCQGGDSRSA